MCIVPQNKHQPNCAPSPSSALSGLRGRGQGALGALALGAQATDGALVSGHVLVMSRWEDLCWVGRTFGRSLPSGK